MKTFTTLGFLLFSLTSFAQFWGVGTQWTYTGDPILNGFPNTLDIVTITEDTIIDNRTVYKLNGTCSCKFKPEYLSEEGKQMYYFYEGDFHLLYDFSLVAGDTLRISTTAVPDWMLEGIDSLLFAIDSVSLLPFNGENLVVQYARSVGGIDSMGVFFDEDVSEFYSPWIEHIGARNCLFPMGLCEKFNKLRCFQTASGETLNFTIAESCLINSTTTLANLDISIFPNPIPHSFQIENPEGTTYHLRIYDLNGRLMDQQLNQQAIDQTYDQIEWPTGMYIIEIEKEGERAYQKMMKLE